MTTHTECAIKQEFLNSWNCKFQEFLWSWWWRHVRAPCAILPNKILSMRAPYLYINVTHVSSSEEPSRVHYANIVYNQEGTPKMKCMLIFWEMRDSSMSFTPILPKTSQHTIHKVYVLGTQLTLPKSMGNNTIFLFQKVWHLLPGLHLPGSMHSQATPGMHTIELMIHNQNTHHKLTSFT